MKTLDKINKCEEYIEENKNLKVLDDTDNTTTQQTWSVNVQFVSFESEAKRDFAYKLWVKLFLKRRTNCQ